MMKPGDFVIWYDARNNRPVKGEWTLWSSIEKRWVPAYSTLVHLLVHLDEKKMTWMNSLGTFSAYKHETVGHKKNVNFGDEDGGLNDIYIGAIDLSRVSPQNHT